MKVICLNDQHKPNDFPASKWIKKGQHSGVPEEELSQELELSAQ